MKKIKIILLIFVSVLLLTAGIVTILYNFNTDFYIRLKYGKDVYLEEYAVNNHLDVIKQKNVLFKNYIKLEQFNTQFTICDDNSLHKYVHLSANISVSSGHVYISFYNVNDLSENQPLKHLEDKHIVLSIPNEKINYISMDDRYLYCLTENGKIYAYEFSSGEEFESRRYSHFKNLIENLEKNIYRTISENTKFKEIINTNEFNNIPMRLYGLTSDDKIIFLSPSSDHQEVRGPYSYIGLTHFIFNSDGSIKYHNMKYKEEIVGPTIVDESGNKIIVYAIFTANHEVVDGYTRGTLFVIDVNGNIYSRQVNNNTTISIDSLEMHSDKKVKKITFVYDSKEKADKNDVKDVVITYTDGTHIKFEDKPINVTLTSLE